MEDIMCDLPEIDMSDLSIILKERAKRQRAALSKVTLDLIKTYTNSQIEEVIDKLIRAEMFALRVTRPLYVKKIRMINSYLRDVRGVCLKTRYEKGDF